MFGRFSGVGGMGGWGDGGLGGWGVGGLGGLGGWGDGEKHFWGREAGVGGIKYYSLCLPVKVISTGNSLRGLGVLDGGVDFK